MHRVTDQWGQVAGLLAPWVAGVPEFMADLWTPPVISLLCARVPNRTRAESSRLNGLAGISGPL